MATKVHTAEAAIETFANAGNKAFKENFEKAVSAFGDFNTFSKDNVEALVESVTKAGKGVEQINAAAMAYTKSTMEDGVAAAKKFASAKSVQEIVELQTDFAKSSLDTYIGEVNKMTDLVASTMKDTFKPINERVSAAVEFMQSNK
ncbi:MAG: TIGR01841 family phasin [Caulobacterales bacterium]|nr:TIGR01841 family phasin [Caulobacterales bacterium]